MDRDDYSITYSSPVSKGVISEKNLPDTMRDSVKLSLGIFKPAGDIGTCPVILDCTPFTPRFPG